MPDLDAALLFIEGYPVKPCLPVALLGKPGIVCLFLNLCQGLLAGRFHGAKGRRSLQLQNQRGLFRIHAVYTDVQAAVSRLPV